MLVSEVFAPYSKDLVLRNYTLFGLMTAVETLLSQSYGAREFSSFRIWAGISLVIVFFATIVVSGGMALCEAVMRVIVQDPALAHQAGLFSLKLIPGLFPYYGFCVLSYYLQNANIFWPPVWIGLISNGINVLLNWALIFRAGWGIAGCPTATSLTRLLEFFMIVVYMLFKRSPLLEHIWPSFSCEHFSTRSLAIFMEIAVPGAFALLGRNIAILDTGFAYIISLFLHFVCHCFCIQLGVGFTK